MDEEVFAFSVDALYAVLDLPAPLRSEIGDSHLLTVDDVAVTLAPTPNGAGILVSATVGPLASAEPRRRQEAEAVLRMALPLTADNAAAVTLEGADVVATARVPLPSTRSARPVGLALKLAVEQVIDRVSWHGTALGSGPRPLEVLPSMAEDDVGQLIFRP